MFGENNEGQEAMSVYSVTLSGPAPWGFRLQGGKDFSMPLTVSRLTPGGKAAQAGVGVGDWVVSISDTNAEDMTHVEAQNKIRAATDSLTLALSKAFKAGGEQKDSLAPASVQPKYSFAPSTTINKMARPFSAGGGSANSGPAIKPVAYSPKLNTQSSQGRASMQQPQNGWKLLTKLVKISIYVNVSYRLSPLWHLYTIYFNFGLFYRGEATYYGDVCEEYKHGLRVENLACFIPNDRSKERLIQDTEDWQPRTGTTQSRSFRILAQLTGTDFMQDPDDEIMKRSSQVFCCNSKTNVLVLFPPGPGSKTAAAAGSSGPSARPPWVTDPNFADRFRPDKTSTVVTQHQQPVQPTPMQNRSSILQAAQHAAEDSGSTPVCGACNKIIRGRYLVALGRSWHPEEFTCSQCKAVLDEGGFFEERGSVYCTKCHDNRYAPNCAKCKKKITGEIMHALKMTYHVQCFKCAACKTAIRNQAFYMEEGEPYCEKDYEKMFGTKCHGCDFKIDAGDRFLEALGYSWHDSCFVCALCQINLEGKTFYSKKDKPLCKGHAFAPV
ncbi:PDZ and LIM domain protein 7 [Anarrhichthys ocellatus]|uniref:PDZ and LIM domain protein 7 n=1 Tax=Anarrhichthys ocellatus TaxID=433405 RepID=UPI0012ED6EF7|nr:PDZ and LIM domain protein 7 [Anarrhichthys ocellatus]